MDLVESKLNELQNCNDTALMASKIYIVCTSITPAFYRKLSAEDMQAEITSIKMLIQDIDAETLTEMCKRAVINYPKARSEDSKVYFDINYILSFYKGAYNDLHCNNILLPKGTRLIERYYDNTKKIMHEKWQFNNDIYNISCITNENDGTHKDFEAEYGVKWRPQTHKLRIYDFTNEELVSMFEDLDAVEL